MADYDQDTREYFVSEILAGGFFSTEFSPSRLDIGAATHPGHQRSENQDHYAVFERRRTQQVVVSDISLGDFKAIEDTAYLLIIADGVGGAAFGEFASRLVIRKAWELTGRAASWVMKLQNLDAQQVHDRIQAYVKVFQQTLQEHGDADSRLGEMGTTMTAVYVMGHDAIVAHIGDSRAYLHHEGQLSQLTRDQTVAQQMLELGCEPDQVSQFHRVLSNCLSSATQDVEAEIHHVTLANGDRLLLCTDGLTNELDDDVLGAVLGSEITPQAVCDSLLEQALDHGGRDNITMIVGEIHDQEASD